MSKVNITEIEKVAKLSRIELDANELDKVTEEFESILDFVEIIEKADTKGVEPTSQVTGLSDVWRDDVVMRSEIEPKDLISAAPEIQDGYIKVKKVL
jgi:aspartyl-tRNA(Asn)/glutamyl-tRNA(Gln) amidotransferase subunit C